MEQATTFMPLVRLVIPNRPGFFLFLLLGDLFGLFEFIAKFNYLLARFPNIQTGRGNAAIGTHQVI